MKRGVAAESKASLLSILNSGCGVGIVRISGRTIRWCNSHICQYSGYTAEELEGASAQLFYDSVDEFLAVGERLYSSGRAESRLIRKDGRLLDVVLRASPLDGGDWFVTVVDITEQKQAEKKLRFTQSSVEHCHDAISWANRKGEIVYVNEAACVAAGLAREELLKTTVFDLDPDLTQQRWDELWEHLGQGSGAIREGWTRRSDGALIPVEISSRCIRDGEEEYMCGVIRDVTARKQAEEAIRESEERYRSFFRNSPIALMEVDISGVRRRIAELRASGVTDLREYAREHMDEARRILLLSEFVYVNEAALRLYEAADKEGFRKGFLNFLSRADAEGLAHDLVSVDQAEKEVEEEALIFTSKGNPIHVRSKWAAIPGSGKGGGRVLVSNIDITGWKRTEEALRMSEEKYRDIFERAMEGIFQCAHDGTFVTVNPAFASMLGYETPKELLGCLDARQLCVDGQLWLGNMRLAEASDGFLRFETQFRRKDGAKIWVSANMRAVRDKAGKTLMFEGAAVDITGVKKAEDEKLKLQAQLRQSQKMEAIGTLVSGISHDFNNILTAMLGFGTLLQMKMARANPLRKYVEQILRASQRAANLTHGLLTFSRQQSISMGPVRVDDILRAAEKLLRRLLTDDIGLATVPGSEGAFIMADATQIEQIVVNLVTNARDAMPRGGMITMETGLVELDQEFKKAHGFGRPGRYVCLSVSDNGIGMDDATKEKIFDPFFTTKETGKGTGLGLAIVYGIVKQHGGYIAVHSAPGAGARFHVYLPAMEPAADAETRAPDAVAGGKETVLVAEDDEAVREFVIDVLSQYGYSVIGAADGQEAIELFSSHRGIDVLILDAVMPRKNGHEVYEAARSVDPTIRAIFMSGYAGDITSGKGIVKGEFDVVSKPLEVNRLLRAIRELLDR